MAISRKKKEAITKLYDAEVALCKYRGIPYDEYRYPVKGTINDILSKANRILEKTNEPLPNATEKQIKFLEILLSKDYNSVAKTIYEDKKKEGKIPNRFQVSELISELKYCDDLIYGHYNVCQEEFDEIDKKIETILSMV